MTCIALVTEDEALVRMLAIEVLEEAGFDVIEAQEAGEGIEILATRAMDVRLLFTDVHMPGEFDGLYLAHHVHKHWPWIALLIASGKAIPGPLDIPAGSRFLPKPYTLPDMLKQAKELIVGQSGIGSWPSPVSEFL